MCLYLSAITRTQPRQLPKQAAGTKRKEGGVRKYATAVACTRASVQRIGLNRTSSLTANYKATASNGRRISACTTSKSHVRAIVRSPLQHTSSQPGGTQADCSTRGINKATLTPQPRTHRTTTAATTGASVTQEATPRSELTDTRHQAGRRTTDDAMEETAERHQQRARQQRTEESPTYNNRHVQNCMADQPIWHGKTAE
jgi:hypothetical protein